MKTLIFLALFFLFLTSCIPTVTYERKLVNSSSYDIRVIKSSSNSGINRRDSILIAKNSFEILEQYSDYGKVSDYVDCNAIHYDSISVQIVKPDSLKVSMDFNNPKNWTFHILQEKNDGGGQCECYSVLTDNEIH